MKKILITGVNGYIGSCIKQSIKKKFRVIGLDKKKHLFINEKFLNYDLNQPKKIIKQLSDKTKKDFFLSEVGDGCKTSNENLIIHLAGESTLDNIKNKKSYYLNNVKATKNLIYIANKLNINRIIFASTAAVYEGSSKLLSEKSKLNPNNVYGITKLICEKLIKKSFSKKNKSYIIFRFFNVCGPIRDKNIGEVHSPETHLIPLMVTKIIDNSDFKIYGSNYGTKDGTCIRDYIHVNDLCRAFVLAIRLIEKKNIREIINLGTGKGHSVLEAMKVLLKIIKKNKPNLIFTKNRNGDLSRLVCSSKKASRILKWKPINSTIKKILIDEIWWRKLLLKRNIKISKLY
jgi:UDP-glucose 4-epimerase